MRGAGVRAGRGAGCRALLLLAMLATTAAINRSVYKVILNQKGFTQFIQYDVETPPIREFTFCTWIKAYGFQNEQSIFTYIVNGNKRVVRLWLDSGGHHLKVLFNEREVSSVPAELGLEVWRHVCLSYQADFGAWALYLDSRLISCEASQALQLFVIPGGGSVILGYGTTEQGGSTGLEGEIFGANMILTSTIGRNHTIRNHPQHTQKSFQQNKVRASKNIDYVVLNNLDTEKSPNFVRETKLPIKSNASKSFIKVQTPFSFIEHAIGVKQTTEKPIHSLGSATSHESEVFDFVMDHKELPLVTNAGNMGISTISFEPPSISTTEQYTSDTRDFLMIPEYETPPPPLSPTTDYSINTKLVAPKMSLSESVFQINNAHTTVPVKSIYNKDYDISEIEVPPPLQRDKKVYGQWISSKYAGSVLNYLKSINFYKKDKKVPTTIPLTKVSDNFPYASNLNSRVVLPPTNFQKKNNLAEKRLQYQAKTLRRKHIEKRAVKSPQINVKILEHDIRADILKSHASSHPTHVEIINRGKSQNKMDTTSKNQRYIRNNHYEPGSFQFNDLPNSSSMFNVLPFLKSFEYFTGDTEANLANASEDMYTKSFSNGNKWHNIKTYNSDYTPRRVPSLESSSNDLDQKISEANKRHPSVLLKYKPDSHRIVHENNDEPMVKGRLLAKDVSHQSENSNDKVSILKYNHGFLPGHTEIIKNTKSLIRDAELRSKAEFHKRIKIGNALNERNVIGTNEEQKKHSFLGGDETVPDINRYRSDIDNVNQSVPPSLKPMVCKNVELLDHLLYVHPDGSIHMSRIVSPIQSKNIALEFIIQNYKKCSLDGSPLGNNFLLLIDWSKTPVRLFGGAMARRTKDLCGFF